MNIIKILLGLFISTTILNATFHVAQSASVAISQKEKSKKLIMFYGGFSAYVRKKNGEMSGPIAEYITKLSHKSGIEIEWALSSKHSVLLKQNQPNRCSNSYIKTAERLNFLKFSDPIRYVPKYVVLAHKDYAELKKFKTFKDLVLSNQYEAGLLVTMSYGSYIDQIVASKTPAIQKYDFTQRRITSLVRAKKYHYTLATELSAKNILKLPAFKDKMMIIDHLADLEKNRVPYHIACTLSTPNDVIQTLNQYIKTQAPITN